MMLEPSRPTGLGTAWLTVVRTVTTVSFGKTLNETGCQSFCSSSAKEMGGITGWYRSVDSGATKPTLASGGTGSNTRLSLAAASVTGSGPPK